VDDETFCAKKNPAKGLYTALKGKSTNNHVKRIFLTYAHTFLQERWPRIWRTRTHVWEGRWRTWKTN